MKATRVKLAVLAASISFSLIPPALAENVAVGGDGNFVDGDNNNVWHSPGFNIKGDSNHIFDVTSEGASSSSDYAAVLGNNNTIGAGKNTVTVGNNNTNSGGG